MYPDFILARTRAQSHEWVVLETKGGHLADNPDTTYKKQLVERLVAAFDDQRRLGTVGELEIWDGDEMFECSILMEVGWETAWPTPERPGNDHPLIGTPFGMIV